jgi:hypothetical protein
VLHAYLKNWRVRVRTELRLRRAKPRQPNMMLTNQNRSIYPYKNENGAIRHDSMITKRQFAKALVAELRDGQRAIKWIDMQIIHTSINSTDPCLKICAFQWSPRVPAKASLKYGSELVSKSIEGSKRDDRVSIQGLDLCCAHI